MGDDYTFAIEQERKEKDYWFRGSHESPIPHPARHGFQGLAYYPIDSEYRFRVRLQPDPQQEVLTFPTSKGTEQKYSRHGHFDFVVDGKPVRLHAYKSVGPRSGRDSLFVPFRDATSGSDTYGAGRYLDLEPEAHGAYELDFNRAYNPYCAYSDDYVCPLPPPENWLTVPIPVGEKTWGAHERAAKAF